MGKLKQPKNFRTKSTKCCFTCFYLKNNGDGTLGCIRPKGPLFNTEDGYSWYMICDFYKQDTNLSKLRTS